MIVSKTVSLGKKSLKYFIGYKDDDKGEPLCIIHRKISGYEKTMKLIKCLFIWKMIVIRKK